MRELATRTAVGIILILIALASALLGGTVFAVLVALMATVMYLEWSRIVRDWGFLWQFYGFVYCLMPAVALLWIRERDAVRFSALVATLVITDSKRF